MENKEKNYRLRITPKAARVNAGMTIPEACKALGICRAKLGTYEFGRIPKSNDDIEVKMCKVYNLNIGDIFFGN